MSAKIELEQSIMECWSITEDLQHVLSAYDKLPPGPEKDDKIMNLIIGLRELYELKFQKCHETYLAMFKEERKDNEN